jgi:HD superfamily phosphodiesterase
MKSFERIFEEDERIEEAYDFAKTKYLDEDLAQHNWEHIVGNLYRALKIAEEQEEVNYSVLIVSVLFHDIGVTEGPYEQHEEKSVKIAKRELPKFDFADEEIDQVVHCISTVSEGEDSKTIEAKICSDADKLVKAGFASIFNFFRVQRELDKDLGEMLEDLSKYRRLEKEGFYTEKAYEIADGGFDERIEFLKEYRKALSKRPDFTSSEEDLFD